MKNVMKSRSYVWKAVDSEGRVLKGIWELEESNQVRARLFEQGYIPLLIRPQTNWLCRFSVFKIKGITARLKFWSGFAKRLGLMLEAGVPLLTALEIMAGSGDALFSQDSRQWWQVKEYVQAGFDLSASLAKVIPPPSLFVRSMIKAGEQTGRLAQSLLQLADELEQEYILRRKLMLAVSYPSLLLLVSLAVVYVLGVVVLPTYETVFRSLDAELPTVTKVIFSVVSKLPWLGLIMFGAILIPMFAAFLKNPRHIWNELEKWLVRLPGLTRIYRLRDLAQFSQVLSVGMDAGMHLTESLRLTADTLRTPQMKELTYQLILGVRQGKRLSLILKTHKVFPVAAGEMLAVAEESGRLSVMLQYLAHMFRMELEERLEKLTRLIEPILIVALAGIIGLVAMGVLLPVFEVGTHLK